MPYITRALEPVLRTAAAQFPAIVLTGPRQSGKTTLLRHAFGKADYVSLEPPDIRAAAAADPRGFLDGHHPPVIFDEVQYAPDLLPYIKERIDERREEPGQYTPRPAMAAGIRAFQEDLGQRSGPGFVVHPGDIRLPLAPEGTALPFQAL